MDVQYGGIKVGTNIQVLVHQMHNILLHRHPPGLAGAHFDGAAETWKLELPKVENFPNAALQALSYDAGFLSRIF